MKICSVICLRNKNKIIETRTLTKGILLRLEKLQKKLRLARHFVPFILGVLFKVCESDTYRMTC